MGMEEKLWLHWTYSIETERVWWRLSYTTYKIGEKLPTSSIIYHRLYILAIWIFSGVTFVYFFFLGTYNLKQQQTLPRRPRDSSAIDRRRATKSACVIYRLLINSLSACRFLSDACPRDRHPMRYSPLRQVRKTQVHLCGGVWCQLLLPRGGGWRRREIYLGPWRHLAKCAVNVEYCGALDAAGWRRCQEYSALFLTASHRSSQVVGFARRSLHAGSLFSPLVICIYPKSIQF